MRARTTVVSRVPRVPVDGADAHARHSCRVQRGQHLGQGEFAPKSKLLVMAAPGRPDVANGESELAATESVCAHGIGPAHSSRARLLKRVFEIDIEHCPGCGGDSRLSGGEMITLGGS